MRILVLLLLTPSFVRAADNPRHWAFVPPRPAPTPAVQSAQWPQTPIDHHILAALEAKGLRPNPEADRRTLIRRLSFDLLGLPPSPQEVEAFIHDPAPDAYERLVDRMLASPHYGERYGRHWLDVARYADSNGLDENVAHGNAYRYRDYVVNALNQDRPYNRFLMEQIAGDLLEGDAASRPERLIATGFLALGPKVLAEPDAKKMEMDIVDEQIDTLGQSVLGLTLGCARCHDHKFDPIGIDDYYALAGIFQSTRTMEHFKKVAKWYENPLPDGGSAMGVTEANIVDTPILRRGNHLKPDRVVPRRFPKVLAGEQQSALPANQSGRLQLAQWLTNAEHPLTARVIVNRIWRWHFGSGLVRSVDNFGLLGEAPSHPALLDDLAVRFMASGWSMKSLHREIVLSATYRQSSHNDQRGATADPDNRLLWHYPARRLEAEAIRDQLLTVGGRLEARLGGPALSHVKNRDYLFDHTSTDKTTYTSERRALYLPVVRNNLYDVFSLFDCTDAAVVNGNRTITSVATQALFWMNSPLVADMADSLTDRLLTSASTAQKIDTLYQLTLQRAPTVAETQRATAALGRLDQMLLQQYPEPAARGRACWSILAQTVLSSNEFITIP